MKKVLVVTYYWPPSGGPGVQRWLKMCKYLPEFGVEPIVLTVDENYATYPVIDESLAKDVSSNLRVIRTYSFEILNWYKKMSRSKQIPMSGFANYKGKLTLGERLMRFFRGNFFLPDARKGWNKYALKKAIELLNAEDIQTVITTGPPHSTHLIGRALKRKHKNIRWIADFRDPWTDIYYNDMLHSTAIAKAYDRKLEKSVLEEADHVLTSSSMTELLLKKSTRLSKNKFTILTNGFDPDDFIGLTPPTEDDFKLVYLGSANKDYPFHVIFQAIRNIGERGEIPNLTIEIVGSVDQELKNKLSEEQGHISCTITPYLAHNEVPDKLMSASLLIIIIPRKSNNNNIIPGKLFEYLAVHKPIIGIGPVDSDVATILEETKAGKMFDYDDDKGVEEFIEQSMEFPLTPDVNKINKFSRKYQARQLSEIL